MKITKLEWTCGILAGLWLTMLMCGCPIPQPSPNPPIVITTTTSTTTTTIPPAPVAVNTNDAFSMVSYSGDAGTVMFSSLKQTCTITDWDLMPGSLKIAWQNAWQPQSAGQVAGTLVWCWQDASGAWQGQYVEWCGGVGDSPYSFTGPFSNTYIHQYRNGDPWGFMLVSNDHSQRSQTVKGIWEQ